MTKWRRLAKCRSRPRRFALGGQFGTRSMILCDGPGVVCDCRDRQIHSAGVVSPANDGIRRAAGESGFGLRLRAHRGGGFAECPASAGPGGSKRAREKYTERTARTCRRTLVTNSDAGEKLLCTCDQVCGRCRLT